MTYTKKKDINFEDIEIDIPQNKTEVYLNVKYNPDYQYRAVCICGYSWFDNRYIVQICNHTNCNKLYGFLEDISIDNELLVIITFNYCWVLENEEDSGFKIGDYITPSGVINGIMKISKDKNDSKNFKIGIEFNDTDNIINQKIIGHDRMGLLYQPILNEESNPMFEKYPKTRFIDINGNNSEEYKYYQDIKKISTISSIKKNKLDFNKIGLVENPEQRSSISRLTRPTALTLQRRDSATSFLQRKNSGTNLLTNRSSRPKLVQEEKDVKIVKSIYKCFLIPIYL